MQHRSRHLTSPTLAVSTLSVGLVSVVVLDTVMQQEGM